MLILNENRISTDCKPLQINAFTEFGGHRKILLKDIRVIREFGLDDRKGLVKTFGVEGVIGNIGRWKSNLHKSLRVITSRDTNWVLIRMKEGKKYVISPDSMELIKKTNEIITLNYGA